MVAQDAGTISGAGSRNSETRIQPMEAEEKQNGGALKDSSALNGCSEALATVPTHENVLNRRGSAMQERVCIGGVKYVLDESHFMSTFVWDRDGQEKKMLRYDLKQLVRFGGLATALCDGTVFTMDYLLIGHVSSYLVVLVIIFMSMKYGMDQEDLANYDTDALIKLSSNITSLVPFVLALYISLVLSRWWALRVQALGILFNSCSNTVMIVSCCLSDEKYRPVREQVVRYGIASILLVVKAARLDDNIETLVEQGLLTRSEVQHISTIMPYQRSTTCWVWILRLCEAAFTLAKCPPPRLNMVLGKAMAARDGVQTIQTYLDTQLPFAYVHLITLLVNIQNLVMAAKCGAIAVVAQTNGDNQTMMSQILMCVVVCIIYQGLLGISYVVHDPFGDDILDFPVVAYTEYVSWSCAAFERAAKNCPPLQSEERLGWLITEHLANKAAEAGAKQTKKEVPPKDTEEQNAKLKDQKKAEEPEIIEVKPTTSVANQAQGLEGLPPVPPSPSSTRAPCQPPLPTADPPKLGVQQKKHKPTRLARAVKEFVATNKAQMKVLMDIQAHMEGRPKAGHPKRDAKEEDDDDDDDDDEEDEDEDEAQGLGSVF
eukprot:gnl/MRDRNA2_/MRDRNA2_35483_c0_seq1.p1 gnl/MRDRNA2_/MRDRNA2_35483_c0~~gnl/MRDRNA2_/MRDRNA2_35483_c0_seq1.p1  ORF type:complete len:613 (+),score=97.54 gnl/MRDRNA2_/MRDRNA2_35483_c0_seq1:39-1841(+)